MGKIRIMSCKIDSIVKTKGQEFFFTNFTCVTSSCLKTFQPLHSHGDL